MSNSKEFSLHPDFSHIYVEQAARHYPDTEQVLRRFPHARHIIIKNYKEIFNRSHQDWAVQKQSRKLILAIRHGNFLYTGSQYAQNSGHAHFYYNALILNCIYDCHYCYLQGMYPSANIVIFVNNEDYFRQVEKALKKHPIYLAVSYDTDLLAFESLLPYCRRWIVFSRQHPELTIEIRTKSANYKVIRDLSPAENVVLAWTLSPEPVIKRYESKTPPLKSRLSAVTEAIRDGWKVRLCFDPLLWIKDWQVVYREFMETVGERIPLEQVQDINLGVFRINAGYLRRIQKQRNNSDIIFYPFLIQDKMATYPPQEKERLIAYVRGFLSQRVSPDRIFVI